MYFMKTTLNIREDLFRRAKAHAALKGITLGRFLEESLEHTLNDTGSKEISWSDWAKHLPSVSLEASNELKTALQLTELRAVDGDMWK